MSQTKCNDCRNIVPDSSGIVSTGESNESVNLCYNCYNKRLSKISEHDIKELNIESFVMKDSYGKKHTFYVKKMGFFNGILLRAHEIIDDEIKGYSFKVDGDFDCDQLALEKELLDKVKEGLAYQSINKDSFLGDGLKEIVFGRIESEENTDGQVPLMVIEGKEYTWEKFGRMLMSYECWDFKLEIE